MSLIANEKRNRSHCVVVIVTRTTNERRATRQVGTDICESIAVSIFPHLPLYCAALRSRLSRRRLTVCLSKLSAIESCDAVP